MEKKYEFGNAFQPSEKEKLKNKRLKTYYKYKTWVPESVIAVGDSYVFYNDLEDLKEFKMGLYEHCKSVINNKGYTDKNDSLEYFNNNIINKLTIYEYLSELNNDMLNMLEVFIEEEKERRLCLEEEEDEIDIDKIINAHKYSKSRLQE